MIDLIYLSELTARKPEALTPPVVEKALTQTARLLAMLGVKEWTSTASDDEESTLPADDRASLLGAVASEARGMCDLAVTAGIPLPEQTDTWDEVMRRLVSQEAARQEAHLQGEMHLAGVPLLDDDRWRVAAEVATEA